MKISTQFLLSEGAVVRECQKKELIFSEGDVPKFFYFIDTGEVKMFNANKEGKEYVQGTFRSGETFGEPPVILHMPYPSSAVSCTPSVLVKLPVDQFAELLTRYSWLCAEVMDILALRAYQKALKAKDIIHSNPRERVLAFLRSNRPDSEGSQRTLVPFTRQEIANATGLRVETVIRVVRQMHDEGILEITERKVYF